MSIVCNDLFYYVSGKIKSINGLYIEFPWIDCIFRGCRIWCKHKQSVNIVWLVKYQPPWWISSNIKANWVGWTRNSLKVFCEMVVRKKNQENRGVAETQLEKFFLVCIFPHLDWIRRFPYAGNQSEYGKIKTRKNPVLGHFSYSDTRVRRVK